VPLTTAALEWLRRSFRIDSWKPERELGATFRPLEETFRGELVWFAANGYLDGPMSVDRSVPRPRTTPGVRD
jgi:hypothetical protein